MAASAVLSVVWIWGTVHREVDKEDRHADLVQELWVMKYGHVSVVGPLPVVEAIALDYGSYGPALNGICQGV